ncbi:hypothetical protein WJX84_000327 [Apatococcus fuscideae]|uniref:Peptide-methionine (R)-S-oxide reductase n=1 Tax=Apatococcus fuscideae TaxID=2026836 RepID=A0AAW1TAF7_9CHLO
MAWQPSTSGSSPLNVRLQLVVPYPVLRVFLQHTGAGFVVVRNIFTNLAGPEGKKATLKALSSAEESREGKVSHSDEEWHKLLAPAAYRILRQAGTELPFSSPLEKEKRKGTFVCAGCGHHVYRSETKFDSGTGWPSFWKPVDGGIKQTRDGSIKFLPRTEVRCSQCEGHLGHVFNDGPPPTGLRFCMNGAAMGFKADSA